MVISVTIVLETYLKQHRGLVEISLQCVLPDVTLAQVSEARMHSVLAGDKRLRPILGPGLGQDHRGRRPRDPGCSSPGAGLPRGCCLGDRAARTGAPERFVPSRRTSSTATADHDRPRLFQAQKFLRTAIARVNNEHGHGRGES